MVDVIAVVEGQSEREFAHRVLAPHLGTRGVHLSPATVGKVGHKGGAKRAWESVRDDIRDHLRSGGGWRRVHVTTMFDYYGMPPSWPGRKDAPTRPQVERGDFVEAAMHTDVANALGGDFDPSLFMPYVQMHELEALLFVDPLKLEYEFVERGAAIRELSASVAGSPPEEVNDSMDTAPSKRIIGFLPEYDGRKPLAASEVLGLIGLAAIRKQCPHFSGWLQKLESLAQV